MGSIKLGDITYSKLFFAPLSLALPFSVHAHPPSPSAFIFTGVLSSRGSCQETKGENFE